MKKDTTSRRVTKTNMYSPPSCHRCGVVRAGRRRWGPPATDRRNQPFLVQVAAFQVVPVWVGLTTGPCRAEDHAARLGVAYSVALYGLLHSASSIGTLS